jgi:death-on-curing protein
VLSEEELRDLRITLIHAHDRTIVNDGGIKGLPRPELLDLAINRPFIVSGTYDDPFEMAAAVAESIAHNHPFTDGNKRTASIAMSLLLLVHNYRLLNQLTERIELLRRATQREVGISEIRDYIAQYAVRI